MVIEQYTITNKYNFPQTSTDTILPQRFLEQSLSSLKQVLHQPLQLSSPKFQQLITIDQYPSNLQLKPQSISIKPDRQETLIAAVDTSTIKIGETSTGMIIAIRGATTWPWPRKPSFNNRMICENPLLTLWSTAKYRGEFIIRRERSRCILLVPACA
jgi:hypothetical protein